MSTVKLAPLPEPPFVLVDTETSGFGKEARVVELAAVYVDSDGVSRDTFTSLVRFPPPSAPALRWEAGAAKLWLSSGGSTWETLHAPTPEDVWRRFCDFAVPLPKGTNLVAYNEPFDRRMIHQTFGDVAAPERMPWSGRCLLAAARARDRSSGTMKLADLAGRLGLRVDGRHRALVDAQLAVAVWRALRGGDAGAEGSQEGSQEGSSVAPDSEHVT